MLFFKQNHVLFTILFFSAVSSLDIAKKYEKKKLVFNGDNTSIRAHPHQVWLLMDTRITDFTGFMVGCGGIIISENFIMTAAHCFGGGAFTVEVRAGSTWKDEDYTLIPISKVLVHPEYSAGYFNMDVALLKTRRPIKFTESIKAIRLPARGRPMVEGTMITVTGWGVTEGGDESERLMAIKIPVANFERCSMQYSIELTENMWCGGYFEAGGKIACKGDSGGPAVQNDTVVGIVSFGFTGCSKGPNVYTNVAAPAVRDFITKHTGL